MRIEHDKFYTKFPIAGECISLVDLTPYDMVVEPSAGNGSFSRQLNCTAYDIEPECEGIVRKDFMTVQPPDCKCLLVIGNPPFGVRSSLAKKFISKSIEIGAKTIAFILPDTFNKFTNQKVFPPEWRLVKVHKISDTCFETKQGDYHVPCSFFIWSTIIDLPDLREGECEPCNDFTFLKRGDPTADFTINGNSGKVKLPGEVTNVKAEHYIRGNEDVKRIFMGIDWKFNSSVNGGISWLNQQDIVKRYIEEKRNNDKKHRRRFRGEGTELVRLNKRRKPRMDTDNPLDFNTDPEQFWGDI